MAFFPFSWGGTSSSVKPLVRVKAEQTLEHQSDLREHDRSDILLRVILLAVKKVKARLQRGCCSRSPFFSCRSGALDNVSLFCVKSDT